MKIRTRAGKRLREPFGKAGLTVAILALVLAMVGGAWAAGGLSGKQKKEVKTIAKSFQGTGPAGPAGSAGAAGAAGKEGPQGKQGEQGKQGIQGIQGLQGNLGAPGKSVTVTEIEPGEVECEEHGGAMVEQEGAAFGTEVCNGETGFTETLPSGKTLKGEWSMFEYVAGSGLAGVAKTAVSFGIPLQAAPTPIYVRANEGTPTHCSGNVGNPGADPGFLCVFAQGEENTETEVFGHPLPQVCSFASSCSVVASPSADPFGFGLETLAHEAGGLSLQGSWAVTAS